MGANDEITRVIAMDEVASSQIHSIGHDAESQTLAVRFKTKDGAPGGLYHYSNFTTDDYSAFKDADSTGSFFYKHIKPAKEKYPFVCVEKTPAAIKDAE